MALLNITSNLSPTVGWQNGNSLAGDRLPAVGDPPRSSTPYHPAFTALQSEIESARQRRAPRSFAERFWSAVAKSDGCWLWTKSLDSQGYGQIFSIPRRLHRAHRVSWLMHRGPIPDGLFVCHTCDVRNCVNPDHLWLGTNDDNMRDASVKGRLERNVRGSRLQRKMGA